MEFNKELIHVAQMQHRLKIQRQAVRNILAILQIYIT